MARHVQLTIERKNELLQRIGFSKSNLHNKIKLGLWCPPISLGDRAVGFLQHETNELLNAHINGYNKEEIKNLVKVLLVERKSLLAPNRVSV